jgi:AcrR family transcriptional regulator
MVRMATTIESIGSKSSARPCAHDRILVSAAHLYALRGYAGTSIREIAQRAGVTKPLIYYHFGSKERLYGDLFRGAMDFAFQEVEKVLQRASGPVDRLKELIRAQVALARHAPEIYGFVHGVLTMPGLIPLGFDYKDTGRKYTGLFYQVVEEGRRSGEFRDLPSDLVMAAPFSTLGIFVARVLAGDLEKIPDDFEEMMIELITHGVEVSRG